MQNKNKEIDTFLVKITGETENLMSQLKGTSDPQIRRKITSQINTFAERNKMLLLREAYSNAKNDSERLNLKMKMVEEIDKAHLKGEGHFNQKMDYYYKDVAVVVAVAFGIGAPLLSISLPNIITSLNAPWLYWLAFIIGGLSLLWVLLTVFGKDPTRELPNTFR